VNPIRPKRPRLELNQQSYQILHEKVLRRDRWRCQSCGSLRDLQVHHMQSRSRLGDDTEDNLITLCNLCHRRTHLHLANH
jgi:5-methylcytosine-specific restriction endonuclease McrA